MEVREPSAKYLDSPGYKQTEVGEIPEDWDVAQIGDLEPFVTSGSRGWAAYYSERGSPFIRITNLSRDCIYPDLEDLRFVSLVADSSEAARTELRDGDVLISITADIGIVGHVTPSVPKPAYINQHIALVRFDPARANSRFISYFLASETPQRVFRALTDSGAKAGMNLTTVQQIRVALPPTTAEQEAIAEALSDADALIESLEQLLAKKHHIKQGAMQELLTGKKRLQGFSGEWTYARLGDAAGLSPGINKPISEMGSGALYVTVQDLYEGTSISVEKLGRIRVSALELQSNSLVAGDIVFGKSSVKRDGIAYPSTFLGATEPAVCTGFSYRARAIPEVADARFLFYALRWGSTRRWVIDNAQASALTNINKRIADAIPIPLPALREQTAIATLLSDMDAELAALDAKLSKARQIKQAMMQALLTGRIRLV